MEKLDRKGVSPVIATILLILIAIAAGVIIYTYTIGFLGTAGPGEGQGEMAIDAAFHLAETTNGTVYIRNTGGIPWTPDLVFVTRVANGTVVSAIPDCAGSQVSPGLTAACGYIADVGAVAGDDVTLKVTATDGTTASVTVRTGA
jgi:flagellin-like protein